MVEKSCREDVIISSYTSYITKKGLLLLNMNFFMDNCVGGVLGMIVGLYLCSKLHKRMVLFFQKRESEKRKKIEKIKEEEKRLVKSLEAELVRKMRDLTKSCTH